MSIPTIYLSGPIAGCSPTERDEWRTIVKGWGLSCIDPCSRSLPDNWRLREAKQLVQADKMDIDKCDVLLAYPWKNSFGTSMEIIYAFERGKKVIVVWDRNDKPSPWLYAHSTHLVNHFEIARDILWNLR